MNMDECNRLIVQKQTQCPNSYKLLAIFFLYTLKVKMLCDLTNLI